MLLQDKIAIVYGAGAVGRAIARRYVREGATVHLVNRSQPGLDKAVAEITADGGTVSTAELDATDEAAVAAYVDEVVAQHGRLDISFNVIGVDDVQGTPLAEMPIADIMKPIEKAVRTQLVTSQPAIKQMRTQHSGVILNFGGIGEPVKDYSIGGFQVALAATDALRRQLATELGVDGIRVNTVQTSGVVQSVVEGYGDSPEGQEIRKMLIDSTVLKHETSYEDVGDAATLAASDLTRTMTGAALNMTCGSTLDWR
ncbi:SDR family oxidoreductase [Nakamurella sp. YIM 132087]|uniref:SDR family oxidoreductase n=1 Tax=Nakamurella alba TaxID=2665158 RepID=A0A7K1FLN4_9ACTN|nr:SDR family oxidoreductase [Nakamurella alba]MTD15055.1 SDR family oxidoreductase [Nakamurella alba]